MAILKVSKIVMLYINRLPIDLAALASFSCVSYDIAHDLSMPTHSVVERSRALLPIWFLRRPIREYSSIFYADGPLCDAPTVWKLRYGARGMGTRSRDWVADIWPE